MANRISAFGYLECSAKTKDGVREVFEMATRAALQVRKRKKRNGCLLLWATRWKTHTHTYLHVPFSNWPQEKPTVPATPHISHNPGVNNKNIYKETEVCVSSLPNTSPSCHLSLSFFFFSFHQHTFLPSFLLWKKDWQINFVFVHKSSLYLSVLVYNYSMPLYMMLSDLSLKKKKKSKNTFIIHLNCQPVLCVSVFWLILGLCLTANLSLPLSNRIDIRQDICHI